MLLQEGASLFIGPELPTTKLHMQQHSRTDMFSFTSVLVGVAAARGLGSKAPVASIG